MAVLTASLFVQLEGAPANDPFQMSWQRGAAGSFLPSSPDRGSLGIDRLQRSGSGCIPLCLFILVSLGHLSSSLSFLSEDVRNLPNGGTLHGVLINIGETGSGQAHLCNQERAGENRTVISKSIGGSWTRDFVVEMPVMQLTPETK
jgi:hypothetical protein